MTYSTNFLKADWSGAGIDFGFNCLFVQHESSPIPEWLEKVYLLARGKTYVQRFLIFPDEGRAQTLENRGTPVFDKKYWSERVSIMAILEDIDGQESNAFLDATSPGELIAAADTSMFFSGSRGTDRQFLEYLLKPVEEAIDHFGPAIIDFCSEAQLDFDRSKPLPIVRTREEAEVWVDRGLKILDEIRRVEEADSADV